MEISEQYSQLNPLEACKSDDNDSVTLASSISGTFCQLFQHLLDPKTGKIRMTDHVIRLVVLVDVSGSMSYNGRLDLLKKILCHFPKLLNARIVVSIVRFSSSAQFVYSTLAKEINASNLSSMVFKKESMESKVNALVANGGTNYGAGMNCALLEMKRLNKAMGIHSANKLNALLLITDGEPTDGYILTNSGSSVFDELRKRLQKHQVQYMSCIGVAPSVDTSLLKKLSECTPKGLFDSVENPNKIVDLVSKVFSDLVNIQCLKVEIRAIVNKQIAEVGKFYHTSSQEEKSDDKVAIYSMHEVIPSSNAPYEMAFGFNIPKRIFASFGPGYIHALNMESRVTLCNGSTIDGTSQVLLNINSTVPSIVNKYVLYCAERAKALQVIDECRKHITFDSSQVAQLKSQSDITIRKQKLAAFCIMYPEYKEKLGAIHKQLSNLENGIIVTEISEQEKALSSVIDVKEYTEKVTATTISNVNQANSVQTVHASEALKTALEQLQSMFTLSSITNLKLDSIFLPIEPCTFDYIMQGSSMQQKAGVATRYTTTREDDMLTLVSTCSIMKNAKYYHSSFPMCLGYVHDYCINLVFEHLGKSLLQASMAWTMVQKRFAIRQLIDTCVFILESGLPSELFLPSRLFVNENGKVCFFPFRRCNNVGGMTTCRSTYQPPEYTGIPTGEGLVYSLGVIVAELVSNKRANYTLSSCGVDTFPTDLQALVTGCCNKSAASRFNASQLKQIQVASN